MLVEWIQRVSGWFGATSAASRRPDDFRASEPVFIDLSMSDGVTAGLQVGLNHGSVNVVHSKVTHIHVYRDQEPRLTPEQLDLMSLIDEFDDPGQILKHMEKVYGTQKVAELTPSDVKLMSIYVRVKLDSQSEQTE